MSGIFAPRLFWLLPRLGPLLLAGVLALTGCDQTDDFFSGRPSAMSQAHNAALDGSVGSMRGIFEIPAQFPDAREEHHSAWQESPLAWWLAPGGRGRIEAALGGLNSQQLAAAQRWLAAPEPYGEPKRRAIAELRIAVAAVIASRGARP